MSSLSALKLRVSDKTATVIGATGVVGRELVGLLDAHRAYARVYVIARSARPRGLGDKVVWMEMPKFDACRDEWPSRSAQASMVQAVQEVLPTGDDFFSCLGTTRKLAGSAEAFRFVDLGINVAFAKTAAAIGYDQFSLVSALGADPKSWFLYPRTKGELELAVSVLPFWAVHLFQPGLLIGERSHIRIGETVASAVLNGLTKIGIGLEADFQSIEGRQVAEAMVAAAQQTKSRIHRYNRGEMLAEVAA